jgi:hypothetical protein
MRARSLAACTATATALGLATFSVAQAPPVRPGQYEFKIEIRLPDTPQPMTVTQMECITPEDAADFFKKMRADVAAADEDCKLTDPVIAGNKVTWDSDCDGNVTAKSEMTLTTDGFTGVLRTVSDGEVMPFGITARWVGPTCTVDDDE